jgi:hypothetical protein
MSVEPFTDDPQCILRISSERNGHSFTLSDGVQLEKDERLIGLHLLNERLQDYSARGASLTFSRNLLYRFRASLRLLARDLDRLHPDLARASALRGEIGFFTDPRQAHGIGTRLGFDVVVQDQPRAQFWRREFWDSLYAYWLMWAYSPASLEDRRLLDLIRVQCWMSRDRLMKLYG